MEYAGIYNVKWILSLQKFFKGLNFLKCFMVLQKGDSILCYTPNLFALAFWKIY